MMNCSQLVSPCDYAAQGGVGVCRTNPPESACGGDAAPVCGCDGVTYPNECARIAANAVLFRSGQCSIAEGAEIQDAGGRE
jgi:hypothetical protein